MRLKRFPRYQQLDMKDCGPASLRMIAKYYGKSYTLQTLRDHSFITREGVSMLGISDAAEYIGFRTMALRVSLKQLMEEIPLPCILHWNRNHFVVCYDIKKIWPLGYRIYIADPAAKVLLRYSRREIERYWATSYANNQRCGAVLTLEPSADFENIGDEEELQKKERDLGFFFRYLRPFKSQIVQLILAMVTVSVLQLIFPFLSQAMVDIGIRDGNLDFITLILIAQLVIFVARMSVEFIRSWVILHTNARIQIALISDFLIKLMKMPLRFFDTKMTGDIMQRISDNGRIRDFMTGTSIGTLFSLVNFFIFALVLAYYNAVILAIFLLGNTLYVAWVLSFMRFRRELDYKRFNQSAREQSNIIQLIQGMQDIKLNNCEKQKRWDWEHIQVKLFKIGVRGQALGQIQEFGSAFITQITNIIVSYIAAKSVVEGGMTLGMMMALTYIIGQVSAPISQFIRFAQTFQDAKISLERLNEIHCKEDEDTEIAGKIVELPEDQTIHIENLTFSYSGANRDYALENVNLEIPSRKVTAIVGASGSGKTTLIKLLQGFYTPNSGSVKIGEVPLEMMNPHFWRSRTGSVMQDGFIFSDTIARNIAINTDEVDKQRLKHAVKVANIRDFISSLPMGYSTKIGMEGNGISQGQKQRILIARAVYKNPDFIFFDEATNSLDTINESIIMNNLREFYKGKTVVIVAHRLSTVKDADNIVVLDKGKIIEEGTHWELTQKCGVYYRLVRDQLELRN